MSMDTFFRARIAKFIVIVVFIITTVIALLAVASLDVFLVQQGANAPHATRVIF